VVATMGRLIGYVRQGTVHLDGLKMLVIDEVDEMMSKVRDIDSR
jgi:superfamily II DNA/RNA helicase